MTGRCCSKGAGSGVAWSGYHASGALCLYLRQVLQQLLWRVFVNETIISQESYFVRPETLLPDEPGYLGCSTCGARSAF